MAKVLLSIPIVLIAAIYIGLGMFIGFFAKTSLLFGLIYIVVGLVPLVLLYRQELLLMQRQRTLWALGLLFAFVNLLAGFDDGGINGAEWGTILVGLIAGGIVVLCIRKLVPAAAS